MNYLAKKKGSLENIEETSNAKYQKIKYINILLKKLFFLPSIKINTKNIIQIKATDKFVKKVPITNAKGTK